MATKHEAIKAMFEAFSDFLAERAVAEGDLVRESSRPDYILCDEIWEILDEAGHGTPVIIHRTGRPSEVIIYNRYASQTDNVKLMNHLSEALDSGCLVTVNGTDIYDLY